eukprot:364041-Chlamydomonas_euryale.AAC.5
MVVATPGLLGSARSSSLKHPKSYGDAKSVEYGAASLSISLSSLFCLSLKTYIIALFLSLARSGNHRSLARRRRPCMLLLSEGKCLGPWLRVQGPQPFQQTSQERSPEQAGHKHFSGPLVSRFLKRLATFAWSAVSLVRSRNAPVAEGEPPSSRWVAAVASGTGTQTVLTRPGHLAVPRTGCCRFRAPGVAGLVHMSRFVGHPAAERSPFMGDAGAQLAQQHALMCLGFSCAQSDSLCNCNAWLANTQDAPLQQSCPDAYFVAGLPAPQPVGQPLDCVAKSVKWSVSASAS